MWIKDIFYKWLGKKPMESDEYLQKRQLWSRDYYSEDGYNIRRIAANTLANIAIGDSTVAVTGDAGGKRAAWLDEQLQSFWDRKLQKALSDALGTGGVYIIPYIAHGRICTDTVPQAQVVVNRRIDGEAYDISVLNELRTVERVQMARVTNHCIEDGKYVVRVKCIADGIRELPLSTVPEWADITPEFSIAGVDALPVAYLSSPRMGNQMEGVPISAGLDELVDQIGLILGDFVLEYKNKKAFIGASEMLFDGNNKLPKSGVFKTLSVAGDTGGEARWEVFDPDIRDTSYIAGLDYLLAKFEVGIGISGGVFTKLDTHGATATEIKSANYNTYMFLHNCRDKVKEAFKGLAHGLSVWADALHLAPAGDYAVGFDWDYSLFESSTESFAQLREGKAAGAVRTAELRRYIYPDESIEEAKRAVDEIKQDEPTLEQLGF